MCGEEKKVTENGILFIILYISIDMELIFASKSVHYCVGYPQLKAQTSTYVFLKTVFFKALTLRNTQLRGLSTYMHQIL